MRLENSFVLAPGIGEKTEKKLWKNGINHWDQISESEILGESRLQKILNFLEKARKNLEVGNTVFFGDKMPSREHWRLYRNFSNDACFFDIETTGLDPKKNEVTTVSFYRDGEDRTLVKGKDLTAENLKNEIFESGMLVSFNGKKFDQPFLEKNFDLTIQKPHIDLMYPCRRLGLTGGLKKIEQQLGVNRELEDIDGREAIRLWKRYSRKNDEEALEKLVRYNRFDARNLETLLEEVHSRLTQNCYRCYVEG